MFKKVPGTRDILPQEVSRWQKIEEISRNIFSLYNYREIRLPLLEEADLFNRSLGESTEIVQKQMFLFRGKEDVYALRPEATASIVRAYIENNLHKTAGFTKLYYIGPMFRFERPQKGRLRQFHHIGCEVIGAKSPDVDVEVISLADRLLTAFAIGNYKIRINSLGCEKDKKALKESLRHSLSNKLSGLCDECQVRYKCNILRILDCKNEECQATVKKLDIQDKHLCPECRAHFMQVKKGLDLLKIDYEVNPYLVRGLDYYTRTVFEINQKDLGAQDAIGAGGRYDNLIADLGGPHLGATGFAFGMERILLAAPGQTADSEEGLVYIITLGEEARKEGLRLLNELRKNDIAADTDYESRSLKGAMRTADSLKARYVLLLGEDELKKNVITLKDMGSGEQREIGRGDLVETLKTNIVNSGK